ncbi:MAG: Gfo/Idh/MocA family oxidoreductase [Armatimonadetes bacterium]|nr:Gfo/Idh/MocA family oxidoreductase [Armatimonadota bacterium]
MAVATPDNLHTDVTLHALRAGAHVIVEKPMCLDVDEADRIIAASEAAGRVVCVDMHKRYDPDHMRVRDDIRHRIGDPVYGRAILEEPLEVSTSTFKWVEQSDPFSYVGPHWVDLIYSYYRANPVGLTAVGQKKRLVRDGINAYDAVQVRVDYDNGMSIYYQNNWVNPSDFEGNVNQEHEIVGADGKVESDQQYRGFRFWYQGGGSRTANNHFTRDVARPDGSRAYIGYGTDSIHVGLLAACRTKFLGASLADLEGTYPTAREGRHTVAIVHAARLVRDRNYKHLTQGRPPCVSAGFGPEGITIIDPYAEPVFERVYDRPI